MRHLGDSILCLLCAACSSLVAKNIHFHLTGDPGGESVVVGFGHLHRNHSHANSLGLASDDVKLVLSNNRVPGYRHTHVRKDWKILCRTQALLWLIALLSGSSLSFRGSERNLLPTLAECFILTTNLETGRESCFFRLPDRQTQSVLLACGHE